MPYEFNFAKTALAKSFENFKMLDLIFLFQGSINLFIFIF